MGSEFSDWLDMDTKAFGGHVDTVRDGVHFEMFILDELRNKNAEEIQVYSGSQALRTAMVTGWSCVCRVVCLTYGRDL
jgi:hypothetical protein